jgi:2-dehydro-3-deoxygalactonokinase
LTDPIYIAVDWGTSYLRAYLCQVQSDQHVVQLDKVIGPGVCKVVTDFASTLQQAIQPWLEQYGPLPVMMAGQIGSSIGWHETAYLPCPIVPEQIIDQGFQFESAGLAVTILPGLCCRLPNQQFDVMRGEELQILGFLQLQPQYRQGQHLLCLPGTHTKWVLLQEGVVQYFKTAMTGELFDLLSHHSVLIQQPCAAIDFDWSSFTRGSNYTLYAHAGNLVHGLFSVRTQQLFEGQTAEQALAYLSGLLIGSDVRAAVQASDWQLNQQSSVVVIGGYPLQDCFTRVLQAVGIEPVLADVTACTFAGFATVFRQQCSSMTE